MAERSTEEPVSEEPGRLARWVKADPVRAVAVALIVASVAWRAAIADRGWFSQDEFVIANRAIDTGLTPDFLLGVFNDHLMPGGLLMAWLLIRVDGFEGWPWLLMLVAGQAAVSVAFYRLLRSLLRPGWALLVPLCMFLFSPLTLEVSSLWMVGLLMLPVQLAMVLALGAQVRYARTGRHRHAISLTLAVLFGLAFDTKALLIIPLVFLLTVFLLSTGRTWASIWSATRRFWPGWLALTAVTAAYVPYYMSLPRPQLQQPGSPSGVVTFVVDLIGTTLVPGLFGGPWVWEYAGDGPPLVDPPDVGVWLAWAALLTLIVVTVRTRASAGRAWLLLFTYVAMVTTLFVVTRLGGALGTLGALVPRYVAEAVVVAALCVGVALLGLRDRAEPGGTALPVPPVLREPGAYAVGLVAAVIAMVTVSMGTLTSIARFNDNWQTKHAKAYLQTSQAELASMVPGTELAEGTVPYQVVAGYFYPYNMQSHFFRAAPLRPNFVTEAVTPSMFDEAGRIRPATVEGIDILPGPTDNCGHQAGFGVPTRIPLEAPAPDWPWWVYIGYLSSGDATVTFRLGEGSHDFEAKRGLNHIYFRVQGAGDAAQLSVHDPAVRLCTRDITVGKLIPQSS
ncbi:hypothetical protein AB0G04_31925 [Actinoplanes sp. NPDC023801]|uniref:hypothetical protein n=1 Tax=Actinoplanes sp. NPDC023801 TaxID=3154595 RepID=UPI0033CE8A2B